MYTFAVWESAGFRFVLTRLWRCCWLVAGPPEPWSCLCSYGTNPRPALKISYSPRISAPLPAFSWLAHSSAGSTRWFRVFCRFRKYISTCRIKYLQLLAGSNLVELRQQLWSFGLALDVLLQSIRLSNAFNEIFALVFLKNLLLKIWPVEFGFWLTVNDSQDPFENFVGNWASIFNTNYG